MFPDGPGILGISESFLAFTCVPTLLGYTFSSGVHDVHECYQWPPHGHIGRKGFSIMIVPSGAGVFLESADK